MFAVEITVRDYECDQQGIVNNSVYLNYLQHARHEYGRSVGLDWLDLTARGINLVLSRAEIDYIQPLRPGDTVRVTVSASRKGKYRFYFDQEIQRLPDGAAALRAHLSAACLVEGKPAAPDELDLWFGAAD